MRKLSLADTGFLLMEKRETPMHVGGLNLYSYPEGIDRQQFLAALSDILRDESPLRPPFGHTLKTGRAGLLGATYWQPDAHLDLDYHVRHSALPQPGRYRELFALVSRLHGTLLDRDRPLWEMHLIEGLQNRQFAVYFKMHHSMIDGMGAMHLTQSMLSPDPSSWIDYSPLSQQAFERYRKQLGVSTQPVAPAWQYKDLLHVSDALKKQWDTSKNLFNATTKVASVFAGRGGALTMPWHHVPNTPLNGSVSGARRFVAQSWPLARVKAVGKALGGTLNDTVLAMCAGALRLYLQAENRLPDMPMKAMTPVSIRREGDLDSSNAIAFVTANLATNVADPAKRFTVISESMQAGKAMLADMTPEQAGLFMQLMQLPLLFTTLSGMAKRFPAFTTVVSNVPGPKEKLYWNGAQLDGIYPASIPFDGFAMNITLVSYAGNLDFGITACRQAMPRVQRLIDFMEDALVELENAADISAATDAGFIQKKQSNAEIWAKKSSTTGAKNRRVLGADTEPKLKQPIQKSSKARDLTQTPAAKATAISKVTAKPRAKAVGKVTAKPKIKAVPKIKAAVDEKRMTKRNSTDKAKTDKKTKR